jgi:multiple antibiotic resistance protein
MDFKPLITLLAIVNPLAIVPFFIHYTQGFSREQRIKHHLDLVLQRVSP